ncbi:hypothetical protein ACH5RR_040627 [Cinchona calisaya]|uniref:Uncharacterized protein n=1 Tax=Cinchona calisaya TaxID=153742 RepID=A0ABD2XVB2_9GENT
MVSIGDILTVKQKMCILLENDIHEIKGQMLSEKDKVLHKCNVSFFKEVVNQVSFFALKQFEKQFEMMTNVKMQPTCSGYFYGNYEFTLCPYDERLERKSIAA